MDSFKDKIQRLADGFWNGKVYGGSDNYHIYCKGVKEEIPNSWAQGYKVEKEAAEKEEAEYNYYRNEFMIEGVKVNLSKFTNAKPMYLPTLEEYKEAAENISLEESFSVKKDGQEAKLIVVKFNGNKFLFLKRVDDSHEMVPEQQHVEAIEFFRNNQA